MAGVLLKALPSTGSITAGTPKKLSSTAVSNAVQVVISAPSTNTAGIWVGDSSVSASSKKGVQIAKGSSLVIDSASRDLIDIQEIYVDAETTGDVACGAYLQRN